MSLKPPPNYVSVYHNPLHLPTWIFLHKVGDLQALIHESVVMRNKIKKEASDQTYRLIGITTITVYNLLSDSPQNLDPEVNVIRPIKVDDYKAIVNKIEVREITFGVAQIYEYFESLLFDLLATYYIAKDQAYAGLTNFNEIRSLLKKELRGKNNNEILKLIRTESDLYRTHESRHISLNMIDWNAVFSLARHSITHSNLLVKDGEFKKLQPHQQTLFTKLFPCVSFEGEMELAPTFGTFVETIRKTNAHAMLIFRGLSDRLGYESHPIFIERRPNESEGV